MKPLDQYSFSHWAKFSDYKLLSGGNLPGIYLLAHLDGDIPSSANHMHSDVLYIGETTSQSLTKRMYQFSRSAFLRKNGHSGGWNYSDYFLLGTVTDKPPENLYVAFCPIDRDTCESKAFIKYLERFLIWEFFEINKRYPTCNKA